MATSFLSPGLYVREIDDSLYVSSLSGTRFGVVTTASWGPVNEPTLVTSAGALFSKFGPLTGAEDYTNLGTHYPTSPGLYALERYLRRGRVAYVVRVGRETPSDGEDTSYLQKAYAMVPGRSTYTTPPSRSTIYPRTIASPTVAANVSMVNTTAGDFSTGLYQVAYTWANSEGETLASPYAVANVTQNNVSIGVVIPTIPSTSATHMNVYVSEIDAGSSAQVHLAASFKLGVTNTTQAGNTVTVSYAPVDRSSDVYKAEALYHGTYGNRIRLAVQTGGGISTRMSPTRKLIAYITQGPDLVNSTLSKQVEAFDGLKADASDTSKNDVLTRVNDGFSRYFSLSLISPPETSSSTANAVTSMSSVAVASFAGDIPTGTYDVTYTLVDANGLESTPYGTPSEVSVTSDNSAITFGISSATNAVTANLYIGAANGPVYLANSCPISSGTGRAIIYQTADRQVMATSSTTTPHIQLSGGADGIPTESDSNTWIGDEATVDTVATGLNIFKNKEAVSVSMIAAPGVHNVDVVNKLISIAEVYRGDCLALIDPPPALKPEEVINWHNGKYGDTYSPVAALNSSYAALFWPWLQVADTFNTTRVPGGGVEGIRLYIPPSAFAAEAIAYTDYVADPWFAPAGLTRGRITDVIQAQYTPTLGERDAMYSGGNSVNPIATFSQTGIAIWGQRTLQRTPTALDRINVRRLLIYLREAISRSCLSLVFDQNDPTMWRNFVSLVEPFMRGVRDRRGVVDYKIIMDASTNTPEIIEQNMARGIIYVKPTKSAEIIVVDFIVTNQSSTFTEAVTGI
jgi:phage tail sheath protein FI